MGFDYSCHTYPINVSVNCSLIKWSNKVNFTCSLSLHIPYTHTHTHEIERYIIRYSIMVTESEKNIKFIIICCCHSFHFLYYMNYLYQLTKWKKIISLTFFCRSIHYFFSQINVIIITNHLWGKDNSNIYQKLYNMLK